MIGESQLSSKKKKSKKKANQWSIISQITASLALNNQKIKELQKRAGRFVLATNRLNKSQFSSDDILIKYKEQQAPERSFGFLKDPLFFAGCGQKQLVMMGVGEWESGRVGESSPLTLSPPHPLTPYQLIMSALGSNQFFFLEELSF